VTKPVDFEHLIAMVVELGLSTIGVRRAAAAPEKRGELAAQSFLIRLAVATVSGLIMVVGVNVFGGSAALHGLVLLYAISRISGCWISGGRC
jgi:hypothetical protein